MTLIPVSLLLSQGLSSMELDYRCSTRKLKDGERTKMVIHKTAGNWLHYDEPVTD
jgi:hypothetical protein